MCKAILEWISIVLAIVAAVFWIWSSVITVPDIMDTSLSGKGSVTDIMRRQSRLSGIAAVFAAVSAILQAIARAL
jgi:hypothetical protein